MRLGILAEWPVVGLGLRTLLESQPDLSVAWLARSARDAFLLAAEHPTDATLVDAALDGALAIVQQLAAQRPGNRIVLLGTPPDGPWLADAQQAGAVSCLDKALEPDALLRSLRQFLGGPLASQTGFSAAASRPRIRDRMPDPPRGRKPPVAGWRSVLSQREVEVLVSIRGGWTSDEIARRLGISTSTVNKHVNGILRKLGARSRAQAAGLLDRPESYGSLVTAMHNVSTAASRIDGLSEAAAFIAAQIREVLALDHVLVALGTHRSRPSGRLPAVEKEAVRLAAEGHRVLMGSDEGGAFAVPVMAGHRTVGVIAVRLASVRSLKPDQSDALIFLAADLARSLAFERIPVPVRD
jgi:DNA-binding NarL/FixJ family response regulator